LRRRRSGCLLRSHVHADSPVDDAAFEDDDALGSDIALNVGAILNLNALRCGNRPEDGTGENRFFREHISLDRSGASKDKLTRTAHRAFNGGRQARRRPVADIR